MNNKFDLVTFISLARRDYQNAIAEELAAEFQPGQEVTFDVAMDKLDKVLRRHSSGAKPVIGLPIGVPTLPGRLQFVD